MMAATITHNESAPGLDRAEGAISCSTTTPAHKEQIYVLYHDQRSCVQSRD